MRLFTGDCLEVLKTMPDNSVDSIVTDPPYGLSFMGKKWDYDVPSEEIWRECLRVLKPGGHLLAFAGTRTQHRMAVRIEDAGFEIRDMCAWIYGQGFPKSLNLDGGYAGWGTALKPALEPITVARKPLAEKTIAANVQKWGTGAINIDGCRVNANGESLARPFGSGGISAAQLNAIPRGTITGEGLIGRFPANLIHDGSDEVLELFPETKSGNGPKDAIMGGHKFGGDKGQNDILLGHWFGDSGSAARFFYCAKASKKDRDEGCKEVITWENVELKENLIGVVSLVKDISEDIMLYLEDKECSMILFGNSIMGQFQMDLMFTIKTVINLITVLKTLNCSQLSIIRENILDAIKIIQENGLSLAESVESISQYQNTINEKTELARGVVLAVCKMLLRIKEKGKSGNIHSTVKPTDLMRYLVRLVTPPGGVVLDPFMGSGSTGKAARLEGFDFIGIEREAEYAEIAKARIGGAA